MPKTPHLTRPQIEDLAARVRRERVAQNLSVVRLAAGAGIRHKTLLNLEEAMGCPTPETIAAVGRALDIDLSAYLPPPPKGGDHA